ncbi:MAG: PaaI family thioesterase [Pseudomonadota bacterium]
MTTTGFESRNPDFEHVVRDSFARQSFMQTLGAELLLVEPGRTEIALVYHDGLSQQHGYFHGGVIGTLADNAGGYAAFSLMPAEMTVLTVEYKLNIVAPGKGERLIARGQVLRPGRTLIVTRSDVFAVDGGAEKLCATSLQTTMCLEPALHRPVG